MPRAIKILEFRVSGNTSPSGVAKPGAEPSGSEGARVLPIIFPMLPIWHIEPFLHRYHDLFCCNHLNSFCESSNLYAINGIRSMSPHRSPRLFQLLFSGRNCLSTSVEGAVTAEELCATFERSEAKCASQTAAGSEYQYQLPCLT
jgi:hypothetical protein